MLDFSVSLWHRLRPLISCACVGLSTLSTIHSTDFRCRRHALHVTSPAPEAFISRFSAPTTMTRERRDFPHSEISQASFPPLFALDEGSHGVCSMLMLTLSLILHNSNLVYAITNGRLFMSSSCSTFSPLTVNGSSFRSNLATAYQQRDAIDVGKIMSNLRPRLKHFFTAIVIQLNLYTAPLKPYYFFVS